MADTSSDGSGVTCPWTIDPGCCTGWDDFDEPVQQAAVDYATLVLWSATGRRFGVCTDVTVRPCMTCDDCFGGFWSGSEWTPYIYNGQWFNGLCNGLPCEPACQVWLPGPVVSVSEVLVDDVEVDPSAYQVQNYNWLVRIDGDCWPSFQDMGTASGDGTFFVTYDRGQVVPAALLNAAGILACEYAKACTGAQCRLPGRVASLARSGVQVTMVDISDVLKYGLTGLAEVDQVIMALNPFGLKSTPKVYSPDLPTVRQVTFP